MMQLPDVWRAIPGWCGGPRRERSPRGRVASLLVLTALSLMALVVPAGPAVADAVSAKQDCVDNRAPQRQAEVTVLGNGGGSFPVGNNPPPVLERNDVMRIIPDWNDRVSVSHWGENYGPNGNNIKTRTAGWPFPGLLEYSAVLLTVNNSTGQVGPPRQVTEFQGCNQWFSDLPAHLVFAVNDPGTGDNGGYWRFVVQIYKA
jgi:hypothetical protein